MKKRGFSLIEIIVAISLVGLIVLFLFGLLPSTGLLGQQAEQQMGAVSYADEILARLDSMSFGRLKDNLGVLTPEDPGPLAPHLTQRVLADGTRLTPEVTLQALAPTDHLVQANIVIRWNTQRRSLEHRLVRRFSAVLR